MDLEKILVLYPEYDVVLGPYARSDERKHVILNNTRLLKGDKNRTKTISYPKALMEIYLNRRLLDEETVDHIDGNFHNNDLNNLQIIPRVIHSTKDAIRVKYNNLICQWCGIEFEPTRNQMNGKKDAPKFCSRTCVGKYGAAVQQGKIQPLKGQELTREYYTNR